MDFVSLQVSQSAFYPIAIALGISGATLIIAIFTYWSNSKKADGHAVENMEARWETRYHRLESELKECNNTVTRLTQREIELMRQLTAQDG